ncbi:hypothetical protein [Paenibacillus favisporus]|uniref:hypothetical protein n=1 Tax=Paenibacillus favisporus TaxID=221028 RepID=UPI00398B83E0
MGYRRKNGEEYLELLIINAVKDDAGDVIQYVGTFSDITNKPTNDRYGGGSSKLKTRPQLQG